MLFIPEIWLNAHLDNLLQYVIDDFATYQENETWIWKNWTDDKGNHLCYNKADYYLLAKDMFGGNKKATSRRLKVTMGYNPERAMYPTVHVIIPEENSGAVDGIGLDEGYREEEVDLEKAFYSKTFTRSWSSQYNLMCTSDNMSEIVVMCHTIRAMLISSIVEMEHMGFRNIVLSMRDITLQQDLVSPNIFHRIIGMSFFYEQSIINLRHAPVIKSIEYKGKSL